MERAKIMEEYKAAKNGLDLHNRQGEVLQMQEYKVLYKLASTLDAPPGKGMNSLMKPMCPKSTIGPFNVMRTDEESLPVLKIFEIMAQITYINDGKPINNIHIANVMQGYFKFWAEENKEKADAYKVQATNWNNQNEVTKASAQIHKATAKKAKVSKETEVFAKVFSADKADRKNKGAGGSQQAAKRQKKASVAVEDVFEDSSDERN